MTEKNAPPPPGRRNQVATNKGGSSAPAGYSIGGGAATSCVRGRKATRPPPEHRECGRLHGHTARKLMRAGVMSEPLPADQQAKQRGDGDHDNHQHGREQLCGVHGSLPSPFAVSPLGRTAIAKGWLGRVVVGGRRHATVAAAAARTGSRSGALGGDAFVGAWRARAIFGRGGRGAYDTDKFGPDSVPVIRPQIPTHDLAVGGHLDCHCTLGRRLTAGIAMAPLANLHVVFDPDPLTQLGNAQGVGKAEVGVEVHTTPMVAFATDNASSVCYVSERYAPAMSAEQVQKHRRKRLEEAVGVAGGKAPLGRLLGYKDGAFVGQMLRGERPVTEDTVHKLESKPGFRSWFGASKENTFVGEADANYAPSAGAPLTLAQAVAFLGSALSVADEATRTAVAPLLARLATQPADAVKISQLLQALLPTADQTETPVTEPAQLERVRSWDGIERRHRQQAVSNERRHAPVVIDEMDLGRPKQATRRARG